MIWLRFRWGICIQLSSTDSEDRMIWMLELDYDVDVHVEVRGGEESEKCRRD